MSEWRRDPWDGWWKDRPRLSGPGVRRVEGADLLLSRRLPRIAAAVYVGGSGVAAFAFVAAMTPWTDPGGAFVMTFLFGLVAWVLLAAALWVPFMAVMFVLYLILYLMYRVRRRRQLRRAGIEGW